MITLKKFEEKIKSTTKFGVIYSFMSVNKITERAEKVYKSLLDIGGCRVFMCIGNNGGFYIEKFDFDKKLEDEFDCDTYDYIKCSIEDIHVDVTVRY